MALYFKNILITIYNFNFMKVKISHLKLYYSYSEVIIIIKYKL